MNDEVVEFYGTTMDEDIAHVACVMVPSLSAFRGEPVSQAAYWWRRLQRIQDECPLTSAQASEIGQLLGELERFEARARGRMTGR